MKKRITLDTGTVLAPDEYAIVAVKPKCDIHKLADGDPDFEADYDVRLPAYGSWGNVCHRHFMEVGASLGMGKGQRLLIEGVGYHTN